MAPRKQVDLCMICSPTPCECFAPKAKAPRKRPAPEAVTPTPITAESTGLDTPAPQVQDSPARRAMLAAAAKNKVKTFDRRHLTPPPHPTRFGTGKEEDVLLAGALKVLAPILHPEERSRYKMVLSSTLSVSERAMIWRSRRGVE